MAVDRKLTPRQLKFIEAYSGNGTEAAKLAGYTGDDNTLGVTAHELLRNPKISEAIKNREAKVLKKLTATREERQQFWSETMQADSFEMRDRLRASELLGKSQADFTDKVEHSGNVGLESLSTEELKKKLKELQKGRK